MMNMIAPNVGVEMINQLMAQMMPTTDENLVVLNFNPDKEGVALPAESELMGAINAAQEAKLEAYVDNVKDEPLMTVMPKQCRRAVARSMVQRTGPTARCLTQ